MKILFFDTETTGLPQDFGPLEKQPHIVQFGAILGEYNEDGTIVSEENIDLLFNPGISIPANLTAIHGVSNEMVADKPSFTEFAKELVKITKEVDFICGHNIEFDTKLVFFEIDRIWKEDSDKKTEWKSMFKKKSLCTMKSSTDFCKLPGRYGFKSPKLIELHNKLFGTGFDNAHNAFADIQATRNCFFEMKKIGLFTI